MEDDHLIDCTVGNSNSTDFSGCNICGDTHKTHECYFLINLQYVRDTKTISRARQTLPKDLEITRMADGTSSIIAKCNYQRGTTFGPFEAKRNWAMNPATNFAIKIFGESVNDTYYLDYSDEDTSNWMCFILPANNAKEQNLICYQSKQEIFYTVMRTIHAGEELRVWYAPYYAQKMKMPLHVSDFVTVEAPVQTITSEKEPVEFLDVAMAHELAKRLPAKKLGARDEKKIWTCRICSVTINSVVAYAKHQMDHYKTLVGTTCHTCNKKFPNLATLEKHKVVCHEPGANEENIVGIPTTANQQQHNAATILKISEEFMTEKENHHLSLLDNSINTNDLLHHAGSLIENSSLKSILENQCLNMNVSLMADSILSENISSADSVKFNVEELSSELLDISPDVEQRTSESSIADFDCDICGKKFQRVNYLYRHLRKHTGEFICSTCLCVFARKENLIMHVCPANTAQRKNSKLYQCSYCPKTFTREKYLKSHVVQHIEFNRCKRCRHKFTTKAELDMHNCVAPKLACGQCGKKFLNTTYLNRHIKRHNEAPKVQKKKIKKISDEKLAICEMCGETFKNRWSLQQHQRSHGERTYECDICNRRFHRIGVLKEHKSTHQNVELPCDICGKKLKSKKALDVHILLHGNKKYQCDKCDKSFFQRCNYLKHYRHIHTEKAKYCCSLCPMNFMNENSYDKHVASHSKNIEGFSCDVCSKFFHTQTKLNRHMQTCHSGIVYRCPFCKSTLRHRHSLRRHFERQHKDHIDEWNKPGFNFNQLAEKSPVENPDNSTRPGTSDQQSLVPKPSKVEPTPGTAEPVEESATGEKSTSRVVESPAGGVIGPISEPGKLIVEPITEFPANLNDIEVNRGMENNQGLMQDVKSVDQQVSGSELLNDVPQLSIDSDSQLAETVLNNTYIFGEDGDIVFYVLDNNSILGY